MSIRSLFIGYAKRSCTTEKVKEVFDTLFTEEIVSRVDERMKKDKNGTAFKIFFVHFGKVNKPLQSFFNKLAINEVMNVREWRVQFNTRTNEKNYDTFVKEKDDEYWTSLANELHDVKYIQRSDDS
jgi:hypothetical protein